MTVSDFSTLQENRSVPIRKSPEKEITYSESGELEPENEERLEGKVPWEVIEEDAESQRLDKVEETKDDPVSQPLSIILMPGGLEGLERQVGGKSPTEEIGNWCSERVEGVEEEEESDGADDEVSLGDLSALLERLQSGIVVELSIVV